MLIDPYRLFAANPAYLWTTTDGSTDAGGAVLQASNQRIRWTSSGSATAFYLRSGTLISGKTYCEFAATLRASAMPNAFGVGDVPLAVFYNRYAMYSGNGGCGLPSAGYSNGAVGTIVSNGAYSFAQGDRIGIAFDPATRKMWFRKNGAWIVGDPAAGTGETVTIASGTNFYFTASGYSCSLPGVTCEYEIYPAAAQQLHAAPAGFSPYQP